MPPQPQTHSSTDEVQDHSDEEEDNCCCLSSLGATESSVYSIIKDRYFAQSSSGGVPHIHNPCCQIKHSQDQVDGTFCERPPRGVQKDSSVVESHSKNHQDNSHYPGETSHHQDKGCLWTRVVIGSHISTKSTKQLRLRISIHIEPLVVFVDISTNTGKHSSSQQQLHTAQYPQQASPWLHVGVALMIFLHPLLVGQGWEIGGHSRYRVEGFSTKQQRISLLLWVVATPGSTVRVPIRARKGWRWRGRVGRWAGDSRCGVAVGALFGWGSRGVRGRRRGDGPPLTAPVTAVTTEEVLDRVRDEAMHRFNVHSVTVRLHWLIIARRVVGIRPNSCLCR